MKARPFTPLSAALGALRPPPCEYPDKCFHFDTCRQGASCAAFDRYLARRDRQVVREPDETPSVERYRRLFRGQDGETGAEGFVRPGKKPAAVREVAVQREAPREGRGAGGVSTQGTAGRKRNA